MTRRFILIHAEARRRALQYIANAPEGWEVYAGPQRRNLDQNDAQWPILDAFAEQLQWPVNGSMVYMTAEEWKDVLTAAFKREQVRLAMGLEPGQVVMLGQRTSRFSKAKFSEWLDFLNSVAAQRGVDLDRREAIDAKDAEAVE